MATKIPKPTTPGPKTKPMPSKKPNGVNPKKPMPSKKPKGPNLTGFLGGLVPPKPNKTNTKKVAKKPVKKK
jgi:hypothetical protein